MNESLFLIGGYAVFKNENPEDLGGGRRSNYSIRNINTEVDELFVSTFVQAVSGCMELDKSEESLTSDINEALEEGTHEVLEKSGRLN